MSKGWYYERYRHSLAAKGVETKRVFKKGKFHETLSGPEVKALAYKVENKLKPLSEKIDIAGSIRRKESEPVDVDIVMVPKKAVDVDEVITKLGGNIKSQGTKSVKSSVDGVDVDVYFADESDYGAQLMTRTGPWEGNIGNRTLAKNKGMLLNQYGLFDKKTGRKLAGRDEKGIYEALGKEYKEPELRGKTKRQSMVYAVSDMPLIAADAIGTVGAAAVSLAPVAVAGGVIYLGAKYVKKKMKKKKKGATK
jgi:DNA polymerase/3'-5' exonuclease PolX